MKLNCFNNWYSSPLQIENLRDREKIRKLGFDVTTRFRQCGIQEM